MIGPQVHVFDAWRNFRQRGAAAVPMVIIVFLISGIVLFYTNRNLIFEQRTSANHYRATQAFEAAEAGLEWALVNLGKEVSVDAACLAGAGGSFKNRYLDNTTSPITVKSNVEGLPVVACSINESTGVFSCSCAAAGATAALTTASAGSYFSIAFHDIPGSTASIIGIEVKGCTRSSSSSPDARCVTGGTGASDGYSVVSSKIALVGALGSSPVGAITTKSGLTLQGSAAALGVFNADPATSGITVHTGGTVEIDKMRLVTVPGSDPTLSIIQNDTTLSSLTADKFFESFFDMSKADYKANMATVVDCASKKCGTQVEAAYAAGARIIWVEGDFDDSVQVGSVSGTAPNQTFDPVVLVVNGSSSMGGNSSVVGLYYSVGEMDVLGGANFILRGSAVSESSFKAGNGTPDFIYEPMVSTILTNTVGNFVRIPGTWIDRAWGQ